LAGGRSTVVGGVVGVVVVVVGAVVVVGGRVPAARCSGIRADVEPHAASMSIAAPTATTRLVTGWTYTAVE
jgi:hypothetical protein